MNRMKPRRLTLTLAALSTLMAAACRLSADINFGDSDGLQPEEERRQAPELPTEAPTEGAQMVDRRARVIGYDRNGISVYDPETGERAELLDSPLWLPEEDLREISTSGLVAVRSVSQEWVPIDLALTILDVPQGRLVKHIPLFSPEYQDRLREGRASLTWLEEDWALALLDRWYRPHWAPDGRSVAFAASIDGPSADVYLYDVDSDELRRLTQEPDQAIVLGMSPDGEWIAYVEAFDLHYNDYEVPLHERYGYAAVTVRAVSTSTGRIVELYQPSTFTRIELIGWYSPTEFALAETSSVSGLALLYRADIVTRTPVLLYGGGFEAASVDPASRMAAFTVPGGGAAPAAVHLVEASDHRTLIVLDEPQTGGYAGPIPWVPELARFLTEAEAGIAAISPHGEEVLIYDGQYCLPHPSADGLLLVFWGCDDMWPGISLYYSSGEWYSDYEAGFVQAVEWGPDFNELFILQGERDNYELVKLTLSTGDIDVVDREARAELTRVEDRPAEVETVQAQPTDIPPPPSGTPSPNPTARPYQGTALDPSGPWLVSIGYDRAMAMNADGGGSSQLFSQSGDGYGYLGFFFSDFKITDSGWVAARSDGDDFDQLTPTLLITRLPETESIYEIPILSEELAARLFGGDELYITPDFEELFLAIHGEFIFNTFAWSPDERLLAFVAALDGDSADLYVFDVTNGKLTRITDGPHQPRLLGWSPDSQWVIHEEFTLGSQGDSVLDYQLVDLWAAAADGSGAKRIPGVGAPLYLGAWLSDTQFAAFRYEPSLVEFHDLEFIDIDQGYLSTIYTGEVYEWLEGPEPHLLALVAEDRGGDPDRAPLYVLSQASGNPELVEIDAWLESTLSGVVYEWDWSYETGALIVQTAPNYVIGITPELELLFATQGECGIPSLSPDFGWLAFGSCPDGTDGLRIHNLQDGSSYRVTDDTVYPRGWLPDSSGLYYLAYMGNDQNALMFVEVPNGAPQLIHSDTDAFGFELRVVPGGE